MKNSDPLLAEKFNGSLWFLQPGVVYFISAGSDCEGCKSIKIGVTLREGLLRRLRGIQSSNHTRIRLLRVIECATMREAELKERELHKRFAEEAKSAKGTVGAEWFKATGRVMKTIEEEGVLPDQLNHRPKCLAAVLTLFA